MCFVQIENDLASAADSFGSFLLRITDFNLFNSVSVRWMLYFFGLAIGITAVFLLYIRTAAIIRNVWLNIKKP